jgi:ribosomal protein S18 acetylase RimI-like enzyme
MTSNSHISQGLVKKRTLAATEIEEIRALANLCDRHDHLHMRISWTGLSSRSGEEYQDFLFYEDAKLVGYLALDGWGEGEREVVGMVHPAYRRQGIFSSLFRAAQGECVRLTISQLVLVCEHSSASAQAFVQHVKAHLELSEHEMWLATFQERNTFDDRLSFRQATLADLEALILVQAQSFGVPELLSRQSMERRFQIPGCRIFLATFGDADLGCHEPVGLLRLQEEDGAIGIYGFGVIPDYQGRGYGRQILVEAIRLARSESQKPIMLDVDTTNARAFSLYLSCGFVIKTTYDYFNIAAF